MKCPFSLLLILLSFVVKAENKIFNRITTESGLSSARITSIVQDKKGYLWFGTPEGLNRYDGFSFTCFQTEENNPNSIQKNTIEQLFEDEAGNIWIFFVSGEFSFYNSETELFVNFRRDELTQLLRIYGKATCFTAINTDTVWIGTENGLLSYQLSSNSLARHSDSKSVVSNMLINQITIAKDKSIWIATFSGFSKYDPSENIFTDYTIQDDKHVNIPSGTTCIHEDREGYLWIGTGKYGAFRSIAPEQGAPVFRSVGKEHTHIYQFMETWNGDIWIGHNKGATLINRFSQNDKTVKETHFFDQPADLVPSGECQIKTIREDRNGTVWFTDNRFNQGQFYYSPSTQTIGQIQHIPENPYSIAGNQITCLYIDRFNNLWIGHDNYGISFCNLNKPVFKYTFGYKNAETDLSSNHILSVYEDSNGDLWVATTKGLDRISHKTGKIDKRYTFAPVASPNTLSGKIISSITEDGKQQIWITYLDANPDRLDMKSLTISPFYFPKQKDNTQALKNTAKACRDRSGNIWITTSSMGLIQYHAENQTTHYYTQPYPFKTISDEPLGNLYSICVDNDNHIWIGNEGFGVRRLNPSDKSYTNFHYERKNKNSLTSDYVRVLFCDQQGTVWVGTNTGLNRYNKNNSTYPFTHFTVQDGLAGNVIQSIREGAPGVLYIGTNKGLSQMNTRTGQIINYSMDNKLLTNEFIPDVSCLRKSGELVFGTNSGILSFAPQALETELTDVSLFITAMHIDGKKVKGNNIKSIYSDTKDIRIEFLSFNYTDPLKNTYQYKLNGYDKDWKTTDSRHRYARYAQVPSGKYDFLVRVSEDGNIWSYPIRVSVTIQPAWWQSWWFILIVCVLIVSLLYLIYRSRLRIYQVQQRFLEKKVEERTALLRDAKHTLEKKNKETQELYNKLKQLDEQKTDFFTNISHELRTPLTIIKGMTENLEQQKEYNADSVEWKNTIYTIQRNTQRLIRHVNELLDLATMDKGDFHPHITYTNLGYLLHEIVDIFLPLAEKYRISFTASISPQIQKAFFDREIVEQALFNILSNAFKYTPDGGNIRLNAECTNREDEPCIKITVEDDGIGIPEELLPHIFNRYNLNKHSKFQRFESSGIGLAHTKERIESHSGVISCQSQEGKGTSITLLFPISDTSFPPEWIELKEAISQSNIFRTEIRLSSLEEENKPEKDGNETENKRTLLFIEDNRDLLHYLADNFREDYIVLTASDGQEGFQKALETTPDAIISDIMMPVMDGLQLCEQLKTEERTAHIPVLLLTARAEEQQQLEGYYAGADDYILKPFNIEIVKAKIKSLIARTEKLQSLFKESFNLESPEEHIPEVEKAFIRKATQVVLDNLQNPQFGVDVFSSEMAMSRANLFRKLKAATGLSASTFTRNIRLKKAAELLKQKEYTVNEVATLVGFADANYLSRCFKEFYGVTPSNYSS